MMLTMSEVDGKRIYDLGNGIKGEAVDLDSTLLSDGYIDWVKNNTHISPKIKEMGYTYVHIIYRDDIVNGIPSSKDGKGVPCEELYMVKKEEWTPSIIIVDGSYPKRISMEIDMKNLITVVARTAHDINKVYCEACDDYSIQSWEDAPDSQKHSIMLGVEDIMRDPSITPIQQHEGWLKLKTEEGWMYGPVKDVDRKIHPYMLPYGQLPAQQRIKDIIFGTVVRAILAHHGVLPSECV